MHRRILFGVTALCVASLVLSCCSAKKQAAGAAAPEILPKEIGTTGWARDPEVSRFAGEALFEYINGAAEMYHKYDFTELVAAEYHRDESRITADVYEFTTSDRAFGMYTTLRPDEPDTVLLGAEGFAFGANWVFTAGRYIANVYTYDESAEMLAAVRSIATAIEARLTGSDPVASRSKPPTFDLFPAEHRIPFSEKIYAEAFLGQGSLIDVYTVSYERGERGFTLFMTEDPVSEKLEGWRAAITEEHDPDAGYQHLPYDGGRYLHTLDSYHGEIIAGPQMGRLIGMVGYQMEDMDIFLKWLHALSEQQ